MILRTIIDLPSSRRNLFLKPADLQRLRTEKLKRILAFAYDNVPFYHARFKNAGIRPGDITTIGDIDRIPLTTKREIQRTPLSQMIAKNVDIHSCVRSKTSGSSGLPLITLASKRTDDIDAIMWLRAYLENGMRLCDKTVEIRDPRNFHKKKLLERFGIMRKEYTSIFDHVEAQASFLMRKKPDIIEGYPSSLEILANFFGRQKESLRSRLVFTLAELLDRRSRELIVKVFDAELFDYYGSSEMGLISWECKEHKEYHVNADNLIIEFVDPNGQSVGEGQQGEIVCTGLNNFAMPLIRYMQGDIGTEVRGTCPCGIRLPLMQIMGGRKDDFLVATDGRVIPPTIFFPYPFENFEKIEQFRVIQERRDRLNIQLVVRESLDPQLLENARKDIKRIFGKDMEIEFEFLKEISRDSTGKLRKIICRLHK